ncbi:uncharacterized protein LOC134272244 [Saccostrea cucullata]|uniref:uncharacterized protein LOC134272244 n=1 Tax=Saccostrea cuccullata TaxID=36930 RepID=UPI002ED2B431
MIVLYLDDGLAFASTEDQCLLDSQFIQKTLSEVGLVVNVEKSHFIPTQVIEWLGLTWNSNLFSISVPDRRIDDAICCLQKTIIHFPDVTARELARVVGKIISMTPVMDIFKVGRWTGINCGLQDHRLAELASELPRYCVTSKAENTAKQYRIRTLMRTKRYYMYCVK